MDIHGPTRFRPQKNQPSNRFLGAYPYASQPPSESTTADADLNEDDIFTTDFSESFDHHHHQNNHTNNSGSNNNKKTNFSENCGILAALPESPINYYHKASTSTSRAIPGIPKPPQQERFPFGKIQYQSAPVNVPVLAKAMRNHSKFDDVDEDDEFNGDMVLPPHEIVARANTPAVSCSVLEGVGRTLKGRDLRLVRNAVFRRTGFLD